MRAAGLALTLIAAAATTLAGQERGGAQRQLEASQQRLTEIRRERAQLENQLDELRGRAYDLREEINNLERQRAATARLVNELDRQMLGLTREADRVTADLVLAENALAEKRAILRRRLVEIYKRGPLHTIQVLLAAESFGDLVSRYKYLFLVSRHDRQIVSEVERLHNRIAQQRDELVAIERRVSRTREERTEELLRVQQLERLRQQSLERTRATERRTTARLTELAADEQRLANLVARLERERRAAAAEPTAPLETATIQPEDVGQLEWPVTGPIIYRYGSERLESGGRIRWPGIGIRAESGTPVRAVRAGRVAYAGVLDTWRHTIVVDHGGGFYSVYAYLQDVTVSAGQRVAPQAVIGHVGGSVDRGPHLHFELRQGQVTLDPETWLRRR